MEVTLIRPIFYNILHRSFYLCNKSNFSAKRGITVQTELLLLKHFNSHSKVKIGIIENYKTIVSCQSAFNQNLRAQHNQGLNEKISVEKSTVISLLKDILKMKDVRATSIVVENKLRTLYFLYSNLKSEDKQDFLKTIAMDHSVNHELIVNLSKQLADMEPNSGAFLKVENQLRELLTPRYAWLFNHLSRVDGGIKVLLNIRCDLLRLLSGLDGESPHYLAGQQLNSSLKELLSLLYSVSFLNIKKVTWSSPASLLQKISEYEAVHPVKNWTDVRQRMGPYRRCFIFTHHSMPAEPLVILHVALTKDISDSMANIIHKADNEGIIENNVLEEQPQNIKAFIFYSISATQKGLQGVELGNYLIKLAAKELHSEYPQVTMYSTLSPIPSFRQWLVEKIKVAEKGGDVLPTQEWKEVLSLINPTDITDAWAKLRSMLLDNSWIHDDNVLTALKAPLMISCSRYLYLEKKRGYALDSVANFHLRNGAVMWRLNWLADTAVHTLTNSCGLMVNYRYYLDAADSNSLKYVQEKSISVSDQIMKLSRGSI